MQERNGVGATLQHLQAQWITAQGQVQDQLEEPFNIIIRPHEQALFPELWVSSSLTRFTYRVLLTGLDEAGHPVRVGGGSLLSVKKLFNVRSLKFKTAKR